MLMGWDATESSAKTYTKEIEDDQGETTEETYYKFIGATYRKYDTSLCEVKKDDKGEPLPDDKCYVSHMDIIPSP